MIARLAVWTTVLGVFAAVPGSAAQGTGVQQGPRFLLASSQGPVPVDAARTPILAYRLALDLNGVTRKQALTEIARQSGVKFVYGDDVLGLDDRIQLRAEGITVAAALTDVLWEAGLDVVFSSQRQAALVRRPKGSVLPLTGEIYGRITDAKTGAGVSAAEVFLEKTRWRTTTDTTGTYRLADVDTGKYTLVIMRLGYEKHRRPVVVRENATDTVNIVMAPLVPRLEELVTTATGRRRRLDIANDVTVIKADSVMRTAPIRNVTDLLEGRVPGLLVQRTSGTPGDPSRIRIRGASSPLRSNDPIVVVDGIRVYAEQSAARSANLAGGNYATPSPLDYIDPNSIETIEVLKGPSAATLYGQDAANGVIVITTKRGQAGPTRWMMNADHGRTQMAGTYPELNFRWGHNVINGAPLNCPLSGWATGNDNSGIQRIPCAGDSLRTFQLLNDPALTVLKRGHRTGLSLHASGGTQTLRYSLTGSSEDEVGLVRLPDYEVDRFASQFGVEAPAWMQRPQHFKRWSMTSNVIARLGPQAEVALHTTLSRTNQQRSSLDQQFGAIMSTYLDRSSGLYYGGFVDRFDGVGLNERANAITGYYERATDIATKFANGIRLSWWPQRWLEFSANAGIDIGQRSDQVFFPRGPVNSLYGGNLGDTTGYVHDGQGTTVMSTINLGASGLKPIGRGFQFRFSAGANYTGTRMNDVAGGSSNLAPGSSLQGAVIRFLNRNYQSDETFGWYVEPSVGNEKISFTTGLRLDGGSSYGTSVSGLSLPKFPKMGFSYLISDESWFPFQSVVSSLRLRLAYGRASRQPGATDRLRLYASPAQMYAEGEIQSGVFLQTLGNTELRPERSSEIEGGFDADLLDSRLAVTVTGYRKTTSDALLSVPVAASVYGSAMTIYKNIGVTRNTGLEMDVSAQLIRSAPLTWTTQLQLEHRRDIVVELGPGIEPFYTFKNTGGIANDAGGIRVAAGYPLFGRWSAPILGYADANDNNVIEPREIQLGGVVYVGGTLPNYTASLFTNVSLWHGAVTMNAGFRYEDGLSQRNDVARQLAPFSRGMQDPTASLEEQVATIDFNGNSDYNWIQTVNTLRFNSLAVRYMVPARLARLLGAQTLSFAIQGSNLGLWTNYRGIDPNVNAFNTGNNVTDTGILPQPRTWQLQVNATY